jgi:hypothetical protein
MTAPAPATYPTRRAAAEALGLSPAKLASLRRLGAPLPESGAIDALQLLDWLWAHRDEVTGRRRLDEAEQRLRMRSLKQQVTKRDGQHLAEAQRLVGTVLRRALAATRARVSGDALDKIRALAAQPPGASDGALASAVADLVEQSHLEALGGAA